MSQSKIELFVPGRLCLLGEHSDWAGMHRVMNSAIIPGYAIVSGLEQGIYATAEKSAEFVVESDLEIYRQEVLECEMDTEKLIEIAKEGGFFSYTFIGVLVSPAERRMVPKMIMAVLGSMGA